jgi:hypothetical protein
MPGFFKRKPTGNSNAAAYFRALHDRQRENRLAQVSGSKIYNTVAGQVVIPNASGRRGGGASALTFVLLYAEANYLICRDATLETLVSGKIKIASIGSSDIYVAKPWDLRCFNTTIPIWTAGPVWGAATLAFAEDTSEPHMVFESATNFPDADTRPPVADEPDDANEWGEVAGDYGGGGSRFQLRLNRIRTVTVDGVPEQQRVSPAWRKGEIIYANELDQPEETDVGFIGSSGESIDYIMVADGRQWTRI